MVELCSLFEICAYIYLYNILILILPVYLFPVYGSIVTYSPLAYTIISYSIDVNLNSITLSFRSKLIIFVNSPFVLNINIDLS